ncbi:hypothetical protein [Crenobacter cavernae]|uniref:hypothetical protein n=1 Tax=Crenobacter cavernae TaxID=2290923 RepID=UPI0014197249|nr:hypothetical protein [Crenobacter cavernae]
MATPFSVRVWRVQRAASWLYKALVLLVIACPCALVIANGLRLVRQPTAGLGAVK